MPSHPYATGAAYTRYHAAPPVSEGGQHLSQHSHKGSDYAGPHPSTLEATFPPPSAASDMSLRHRLPPRAHAQPHPYAAVSLETDEPTTAHERKGSSGRFPSPRPVPPFRIGTPVLPVERDFASNANVSVSNADTSQLGIGEALLYPRNTRKGRDGMGTDTSPAVHRQARYQDPGAEQLSAPDKGRARGPPVPPSVSPVDSHSHSNNSSTGAQIALAQSPSPVTDEDPLERKDIMPQFGHSAHSSSAQLVITALDNNDDLDHFRDLFYKPPSRNVAAAPREDFSSQVSMGIPSDVRSSGSASALTNLVRSLSEELDDLQDNAKSQESHAEDTLSQEYVFLDLSRSYSSSPVPVDSVSPHRLPIHQENVAGTQPESAVPEDVVSSRASSIVERDPPENDTFGYPIRHGVVEAAPTPPALHSPRHASTHLSIKDEADDQDHIISPVTSNTGSELRSADAIRSSYMTSASEGSRISNLSDFPAPPMRPNLHTSLLQAYYDATPSNYTENHVDSDLPRPRPHFQGRPESHRTTFGGSEDMNIITEVHTDE
ncbi:hypothetical protein BV22DRAFT_1001736 [Leucogyrophana mollusca]|uniref:Uncharacterized protein n=1 Tax=Leucogyrophana mollusca TaxID=85980 RepID=A0ACB8BWA3_9AGAM|nr:hypothetical protein BV22DRAFT_1001736 [Leucogyrophana mollusca]